MFLLLPFLLLNAVVTSSQYQDCTNQFKNQIAMFEYRFYPGWWSTAWHNGFVSSAYVVSLESANDIPHAKANKNLHFTLHDCGEDTVCIESLKTGWNGYYIKGDNRETVPGSGGVLEPVQQTTLYDAKRNPFNKHKIFCTSCQPSDQPNYAYHDCRIYNTESQFYWFTSKSGDHSSLPLAEGYPNWFQWRIVSPPTREYWKVAKKAGNCRPGATEESAVHFQFHTSISSSVTTTTTIEQKIEVGLEAIPLLKKLGGTTVTWSTSNVRTWARSDTSIFGSAGTKSKMVKPGWKWVIEQYVGEAAFNTIESDEYQFCDIPCSSTSQGCS